MTKDTHVSIVFGTKRHWKDGLIHRDDGPAVEYANGDLGFFRRGICHRANGPAFISVSEGRQEWWYEGRYHRVGGPAIICDNGTQLWYVEGKKHRLDGPAVTFTNGQQEWWANGIRHRIGGPAIIYPNGEEECWINGKYIEEDQVVEHNQANITNENHPWSKAYRLSKIANEFSWRRPIAERHHAYLQAAIANREAVKYCGGNHPLSTKYEKAAKEFEDGAEQLKRQFRCHFAALEKERMKPIVILTKQDLARELAIAALKGYYGGNAVYDTNNGLGKKAVEAVYAKMDEMMDKLHVEEPTSPDVQELENKSKPKAEIKTETKLETKADIQNIQDPVITSSVQDLPERAPVQDRNAKPFDEERTV